MNDWIVAGINNPDFTVSDFHDIADMNIDNTQMLKKEDYLRSEFIKNNPLFLDSAGKFSEDKFDMFYNKRLLDFQSFLNGKYGSSLELDMFDTNRTAESKVRDDNFAMGRIFANPDRQKVGIEGINEWSTPEKSRSELAQASKIWDTQKQEYRDYSPNDHSLFGNSTKWGFDWFSDLFSDPLVMAQYDEEGTHIDPITGQEVKHKKGDYKLNLDGTYYYETLNGRSPVGKQVLSAMDTLTIDGLGINKYDFFDSDDIEKSATGVISKNVATLAPMFIGGPIGTAYSVALIGRELAKSLPMVYGVATSLFSNSDTPAWMNSVAAMGSKLTGGTSLHAKEHTFSFENFGNLISDVALQWGQQKQIAKAFDALKGSKNYMTEAVEDAHKLYNAKKATMGAQAAANDAEWMNSALGQACLKKFLPAAEKAAVKAGELGRDVSLMYMSLISNADVYEDMLDKGASKQEAAAVALGSMLGMYAVDKYGNLGTVFFDDATEESVKQARAALKNEISLAAREIYKAGSKTTTPANKLLAYINKAADVSKKWVSEYADDLAYHTTNMYEKMGTEGLEEVSEELVTDLAKSVYELAGRFGADTSVKDVGAWDNAFDRYTMSFLGGAIGGGVFYGKEVFDGKSFKRDKSNENLATLIRNGHGDDVRSLLKDWTDRGKIGSTKLSGVNYAATDGKPVWLTTSNRKESQNNIIAQLINDKINAIDAIINNNQVNLDDEQLFKLMVLGEQRFARYQDIAPITNYYLDFNNVVNNVISAELDLKAAQKTLTGTVDGDPIDSDSALRAMSPDAQLKRQLNLQALEQKLVDAQNAKNEFLSGDTSLDYTRKLNFAIDPILHSLFLLIDENQIWKNIFGDKNISEASPEDMMKFMLEVEKAKKEYIKQNLTVSWDRFKAIEKLITPELAVLAENTPQFKQWRELFNSLLEGGALDAQKLLDSHLNWDDKIEGVESDDEYNTRNSKLIDPVTGEVVESDEDFLLRKSERVKKIRAYNEQKDAEWVLNFKNELAKVGNVVDPLTYRKLVGYRVTNPDGTTQLTNGWIPVRVRNIILDKLKYGIQDAKVRNILAGLNNDLSNAQELIDTIKSSKTQSEKYDLTSATEDFKDKMLEMVDGTRVSVEEYFRGEGEYIGNEEFLLEDIIGPDAIDDNLTPESIQLLAEYGEMFNKVVGGLVNISELIRSGSGIMDSDGDAETNFNTYMESILEPVLNGIQSTLADIKSNAIYGLHQSLKSSLKNPIVDLVQALAGKVMDGKEVPNIMEVIDNVQHDFDTVDDISTIVLDEAQISAMNTTKDILNLINTYVYAASSTSEMNTPVGHNKVMNEYARNHSDVVAKWQELPEIDSDYAAIYQLELTRYANEINNWIGFSNNNNINKRAQFEKSDRALSNTLWDTILNKMNANAFKVNVDDKLYNLLEGISSIDTTLAGSDKTALPLFEVEKLLYKNFQNALADSGLSVTEFLEKSKLFDGLVSSAIKNLKTSKFDDKLNADAFTEYDRLQYLAMAMTLNPVDFYTNLKSKINADDKTAPITVLEYDAKLATASRNQQYRDILKYAHNLSGDDKYAAVNTTVITGAAGAGKTLVVVKSATQGVDAADILAVGPTSKQASSLAKSLQVTNQNTIKEALIGILGEQTYNEIESEIAALKYSGGSYNNPNGKYFNIKEVNGLAQVNINPENIVFNGTAAAPKIMIVDEATHLNSVYAQILDYYMSLSGGQLMLVGDPNQRGYSNKQNYIGNIRETDMFTTRAPKLTVSLRDNNIQKLYNLSVVLALLDLVNDKVINSSESDLEEYWPSAMNILSKFNFRVYNKEEINGDLITPTLTPEIISKIKDKKNANNENKTVGFVGNKATSAAYRALIDAGFKEGVDLDVMSMDEMLGQEWDYVIIDETLLKPEANINTRNYLQDLYTLMSRGREASIFIDNDISTTIGSNTEQQYKAKAPSLQDKINGVSAVDDLRAKKIDMLNQFDLTPLNINTPAQNQQQQVNSDLDFVDTEKLNNDADITLALLQEIAEEIGESNANGLVLTEDQIDRTVETLSNVGDITDATMSQFTIPSWGDVTYTGVQVLENETEHSATSNKDYTGPRWIVKHPDSGPLRNMLALYEDYRKPRGKLAFWYADKMAMQKDLYDVKSALIFQHDNWDDPTTTRIPKIIRDNFKKSDWENGTYELEIRSTEGEVLPLFSSMPEVGFEYPPGSGKRYIANIVFKAKNKKGQECVFDLSGINNPNTLIKNLDLIKSNINKKINSGKLTVDLAMKLLNIHDTIDSLATKYKTLFDSWIQEFDNTGKFSMNVTDAIDFNHTTWLRRRNNKIRLGGTVDPNAITDKADYRNLKSMNPGMVFSGIYTYSSKKNELEDIDPSVRGKAVVFVTSDTLLKPDELINHYIRQKKDPQNSYPTVRMVMLDNYGMSFSQFMDPKFIKQFQGGSADRKPVRLNFKGIQMFTSLWNFRAGLAQFLDKLAKWKTDHNYDSNKVNAIIKAHEDVRVNHLNDSQIQSKYGVTKLDIENLNTFNLEELKNVPIFRLGYSTDGNGFHVLKYNTAGSTAYSNTETNLLTIDPAKANQFYTLLDSILGVITPNPIRPSLGLKLTKQDGTEWGVDEPIDLELAAHRRSLSKLLHFDRTRGLYLSQKGVGDVAFVGQGAWSAVPSLISSIARTVTYHLYNDDGSLDGYEQAKITVHDKQNNLDREIGLQVGLWMLPNASGETLLKTKYTNPTATGHPDKSLLNLLDLVFHGTVEDFHLGNVQLLEDARFKEGFLIDPDARREKTADGKDYTTVGIEGQKDTLFLEISTVEGLFTADVDMRSAGINLDINKLIAGGPRKTSGGFEEGDYVEIYTSEGLRQEGAIYQLDHVNDTRYGKKAILKKIDDNSTLTLDYDLIISNPSKYKLSKTQPAPYVAPKSFADLHPIANEMIEKANRMGESFEFSEDAIEDVVNYFNEQLIPAGAQRFIQTLDLSTICFYQYKNGDILKLNFQGYLQTLLGTEEFKSAKVEDGKIIVNNKYEYDNNTLVEKQAERSVNSRYSSDEKSKILKALNDNSFITYATDENGDNLFPTDTDVYNEFCQLVFTILENDSNGTFTPEQTLNELQLLAGNLDYDDLRSSLLEKYPNIYNQLFKDC